MFSYPFIAILFESLGIIPFIGGSFATPSNINYINDSSIISILWSVMLLFFFESFFNDS
jgi:hypothetical protein